MYADGSCIRNVIFFLLDMFKQSDRKMQKQEVDEKKIILTESPSYITYTLGVSEWVIQSVSVGCLKEWVRHIPFP
jgi:hypothetical protein